MTLSTDSIHYTQREIERERERGRDRGVFKRNNESFDNKSSTNGLNNAITSFIKSISYDFSNFNSHLI